MSKREEFFECVFVSGRSQRRFQFRAWNESEAELDLRDALRGNGVTSAGTLLIRDLKGQLLKRARYVPSQACAAVP
jgi:hypothetical protein